MSVNRYRKHLLILPEDAANAAIVNGFLNSPKLKNVRAIQQLPYVKGWRSAVDALIEKEVPQMRRYPMREILLLIDFDGDLSRADTVRSELPAEVKDHIYILGVLSEPEKLKAVVGLSFEQIGEMLASACAEERSTVWLHELLAHNQEDLQRLVSSFRAELF